MDLVRNSLSLSLSLSRRRRAPFSLSLSLSTRRERGDVGEDVEGKVEGKIGCVTLFFSLSQKNVVITTSDVVIISENDDSEW